MLKTQRPITSSVQNKASSFQAMARILWPPAIQDKVYPFAGSTLVLVGRLKLTHVIICTVLTTAFFIVAVLRPEGLKNEFPISDASDLLDIQGASPSIPLHLRPLEPIRIAKANRFDNRYEFQRHLGRSREGSTMLYRDMYTGTQVVVKSYSYHANAPMEPAWADLFCHELTTWPTEIPATLLLAGLEKVSSNRRHSARGNLTRQSHRHASSQPGGLVPALDYFVALEPVFSSSSLFALLLRPVFPSWTTPRWTLVTPWRAGSLDDFAAVLKKSGGNFSPAQLDALHRPVFAGLVSSLAELHAKGYCHNNVKSANIFVDKDDDGGDDQWLLSGLGQVRHVADHRSDPASGQSLWTVGAWARGRRSRWEADCRLDDVRRALKSYMSFLRAASSDELSFDGELYAMRATWSRLYWDFVKAPVPAEELIDAMSGERYRTGADDEMGDDGRVMLMMDERKEEALRLTVDRELAWANADGTWGWEGWWRWWKLGGLWQRFDQV
ncbi:hypothetical protein DIS24_g3160 [Lasiodiplodia hormozganensis]|uniref:Protein kinase domain-containing protein n=1 Tax=Lasiodiplodia hormozganensis TaxID=869390 RepID=A0AA39YY64_9PEZI|nr:hypothetical protein DIS24_g3160 [Lasiodiplodia hormozganensis]